MIEIRFHGRGGQGAVQASELLAHAAFAQGLWPQSFPFFGVERRGAPVVAYTRLDDRPIRLRTSIESPDIVVVLDPSLLNGQQVTAGLHPNGWLLANQRSGADTLPSGPYRRAAVDATAIALAEHLGSATAPIVNTAMLGALARASGVVELAPLLSAIEEHVPAYPEQNRRAAEHGFASVQVLPAGAASPRTTAAAMVRPLRVPEAPMASTPTTALRTSSWRTVLPVIDLSRCTRCGFCWKFCPDDAIALTPDGTPSVVADYCKGCGICAVECPPKTIRMVAEPEGGIA
jgi:pyruvate ferredoxin oxidoreductase gamma subunit